MLGNGLLIRIGITADMLLPGLFLLLQEGGVSAPAAQRLDDLFLGDVSHIIPIIVSTIKSCFLLSTVVHGPEPLRYYWLSIVLAEDMAIQLILMITHTHWLLRRYPDTAVDKNETQLKSFA